MKTKLPNEISNLNTWIHQNEIKIKRNVDKTNCNKWKFWYISKESPLPCCCPKRTSECIFLEMYNKLFYSMQLQKKESEFADALIMYERIQLNLKAVMEWVIDNEDLYNQQRSFKVEIKLMLQLFPYKAHYIKLPIEKYTNLLNFRKIYRRYYYSKEYENY